jgi:hypothetical protein
MAQPPSKAGGALAPWLAVLLSAAIVYHLAAVIIPVLNTPSGPWPTMEGSRRGDPPYFAHAAAGLATVHGKCLRVAHSYHLASDGPSALPGIEFEVRLRNAQGEVTRTLRLPDPAANPWVRHREALLASLLGPDLPAEPPGGEVLAPPGGQVPTETIWAMPGEDLSGTGAPPPLAAPDAKPVLALRSVPKHLVPRNRPVWKPSAFAEVLARSYARYCCQAYGAASAEVVRHSRNPVPPVVLFGGQLPPQAFEEIVASFGEVSK